MPAWPGCSNPYIRLKGMDRVAEIKMETIFEMILHGGNGKSHAMEAIELAKEGKFEEAEAKLKEADEALNQAHHLQTSLITDEVNGNPSTVSLLMVHAQDHLMTAMTMKDLAKQFVDLYKLLQTKGTDRKNGE